MVVDIDIGIVVVQFTSYRLLGRSDTVLEFPLLASVLVAEVTSLNKVGIEKRFEVGAVFSKNICTCPEARLLPSSFEYELDVVRFGFEMVSCAR